MCRPGELQSESQRKRRDKFFDLARELKENMWNMILAVIPVVIGSFGTVLQKLGKGTGRV